MSVLSNLLPTLVKALALTAGCLLLTKILLTVTTRILDNSKLDKSLHAIIRSTVKILLLFLTVLIVAPSLGIETSSLLAVLSIVGVAVSLSIQGILENFFSGVNLLLSQPFKVGDYVTIGGQSGTIVETGITHTRLHTPDNQVILVPNSTITSNIIVNVSSEDRRRLDISVSASYDAPTQTVYAALAQAADIPLVLPDPAPVIRLTGYGDHAIEYVLRVWVRNSDYWDAKFQILENIRTSFDTHHVEMTYPHLLIHSQ